MLTSTQIPLLGVQSAFPTEGNRGPVSREQRLRGGRAPPIPCLTSGGGVWGFSSFGRNYSPTVKENNLKIGNIGTYNEQVTQSHYREARGGRVSWVSGERKRRDSSLFAGSSSPVSTPGFQGRSGWRYRDVTGKPERLFLAWVSARLRFSPRIR